MKKLSFLLMMVSLPLFALSQIHYQFEHTIDLDASETKDQCRTGTCWSFATTSFIESELMRMGKGNIDLSEMFHVRNTYPKKADLYVRYHGKAQFSAGSLSHDVINSIREFGMVPDIAYSGLSEGETKYNHGEMDAVLEGVVKAVVQNKGMKSSHWRDAVAGVLDAYLGEVPNSFDFKGKSYTPIQFRDAMGIVADDYMSFTSFTHHPFGSEFILEVPDNFSQGTYKNVKLDRLVSLTKGALRAGYTVAWDADVSHRGFSFKNGMAVMPEESVEKDQLFKERVKEQQVTQESRQENFDNFTTTDDHLMHIIGLAQDQYGNEYFIIKNSWGDGNPFGGKQYISMEYFKMQTIGIMVHKDVALMKSAEGIGTKKGGKRKKG